MKAAILVAAILASGSPPVQAQPAPAAITVTGRVVADDTGEPIANARVAAPSANPNAIGTPVALTDDDGRFTLAVPADATRIVAIKSGFGRREIARANIAGSVAFRLVRGAAISGRVVDGVGEPVQGVRVMVYPADAAPTGPLNIGPPPPGANPPQPQALAVSDTDDRGEYRLASIAPGAYFAAAMAIGPAVTIRLGPNQIAQSREPLRVFYPGGTTTAEAEALRLQAGEDRPEIDFVMPEASSMSPQFGALQIGPLTRPPTSAAGAGIIRGRVVGSDGRSLANAMVRVFVERDPLQATISRADRDGRFEFRDLPAGAYRLIAAKIGYGPVTLDDPKADRSSPFFGSPTVTVTLADGETRERADVTLARWGSIAGRVIDERGDPLQGAGVQVMQVRYERGRRRLVFAGSGRLTDDLGRYRLFSVPPGQYVVSASVGDVGSADVPGYARAYYPGTANAGQAVFVSVALQQDLTGIDVAMSRTRTARISGQLLDSTGASTIGGSLNLMPSQRAATATDVSIGARIQPDGRFEFANVAPGQYVIQSYRGRTKGWVEGEFGTLPVSVDGADVTNLVLQTSSGSTIHGRITFDSHDPSKRPSARDMDIVPAPVDFDLSPPSVASAEIHDDWSFDLAGVNGPRRLQLRAPADWMLADVRVNGISVVDRPLSFGRADQSLRDVEVLLTDRISELAGTVTTDRREPAAGATVLLFATDRSRWYPSSRFLRAAIAGTGDVFLMRGLPFGTYYIAAVGRLPDEGPDAWQDPDFLNRLLTRASTITVRDDQKQTVDLRLVPAR
jgi:protocatechuate 3,4-dioxygenase beta subunit